MSSESPPDMSAESPSRHGRTGVTVRFEQAVYGSFAFRDDGYALLAHSPGCRKEWLADFRAACQRLGEQPGSAESAGLFALRLPSGPWAVVGVSPQGRDDRGRPGALGFHGLFLTPREYRRAGCNPFALTSALRNEWTAETTTLATGRIAAAGPRLPAVERDARVPAIVGALSRRRRVAIESSVPIDDLARQVWSELPPRVRRRASVATWAFGNANHFDLLAAPRLQALVLDHSYVDPLSLEPRSAGEPRLVLTLRRFATLACLALALAVMVALVVGVMLWRAREAEIPGPEPIVELPVAAVSSINGARSVDPSFPHARDRDAPDEADPDERRRAVEALTDLAERFRVKIDASHARADDGPEPAALMEQFAARLRYRAPWLSDAERAALQAESGHDAGLALRWDAQIRRFAADRPLPPDFRAGSLRWQLAALAWSFHCESDVADLGDPRMPRRSPAEMAQALEAALAVDVSLSPTPLVERYPTLSHYLDFLGRLPRR